LKVEIHSKIQDWLKECQVTGSIQPLCFSAIIDRKDLLFSEMDHLISTIQKEFVGVKYTVKVVHLSSTRMDSSIVFNLIAKIVSSETGVQL